MEQRLIPSPVFTRASSESNFGSGLGAKHSRRVFVTVPVRNEEPRLNRTIERLVSVLEKSGYDWKLSVAEDGSTDGSAPLLRELARDHPNLVVQTSHLRLGRGLALRRLWSTVVADIYAFTDADLAAGPEAVVAAVRAVDHGADVAVGSRFLRDSVVRRPPLRNLVSHTYNWLVRRMFEDEIADHQCGIKAFSRLATARLLPQTTEDSWFWDTEILVQAVWGGLRVVEFPVDWTETKYPNTSLRRLMSDVGLHGPGLLRLHDKLRDHMRRAKGIPPRPSLAGLPQSKETFVEA